MKARNFAVARRPALAKIVKYPSIGFADYERGERERNEVGSAYHHHRLHHHSSRNCGALWSQGPLALLLACLSTSRVAYEMAVVVT
jgi:hypothetical protein